MNGRLKEKYGRIVSKFVRDKTYRNTYTALTDNTHMEIENCKKILEYNDVLVKIRTSTLTVTVWGNGLRVSDYNTDGIVVDGIFSSVEFERYVQTEDK
ncbi:MAG: YabP/YqfC family sporulation protein [Prevotella sp.]|nr:YabP/YqfC family sporulation protein [Prevotella sp.]